MKKAYIIPFVISAFAISSCSNSQPVSSTISTDNASESQSVVEEPVESNDALADDQDEDKRPTTSELLSKGNIKVKGAADIEGFTKAILSVSHGYYYSSDSALKEIDEGLNKKAGYWSNEEIRIEGDPRQDCCYWVRDDKKKLICFSELENRQSKGHSYSVNSLCFFVFNDKTKELEPITSPINGDLPKTEADVIVKLPEVGKDIKYYLLDTYFDEDRKAVATLKWNGMGFDVR